MAIILYIINIQNNNNIIILQKFYVSAHALEQWLQIKS